MSKFNVVSLNAALGMSLTTGFVEKTLGIPPDETDRRAVFWNADKYPAICDALARMAKQKRDLDITTFSGKRPTSKKDEAPASDDQGGDFFGGEAEASAEGGDDFFGEDSGTKTEESADFFA